MKWITKIELNNYRAFSGTGSIEIPFQNHALIYGENGSGKTSFYLALKDFLVASENRSSNFVLNKFEEDKGNKLGWIKIELKNDDNENDYTFSSSKDDTNNHQPDFILANKLRGFLDYKKLLKVYALDAPEGKPPNFFNFIVTILLGDHKIDDPAGGNTTVQLAKEYDSISTGLVKNPSHSKKYKAAESKLDNFNYSLKNLLVEVFDSANDFLDEYFENDLSIDISYNEIGLKPRKRGVRKQMDEVLEIKISYCKKEVEYQTFLNEARLSALALSIFLASVNTYKPPVDLLKVLYLDDVFIGMDTSNRFPLLSIIKKEFIDKHYQVFISTYDKEWFEMARQWFDVQGCSIQPYEFYIESSEEKNVPDKPIIIPSKGNYDKAEAYFRKKDYPAAGNYLRKECESILKDLLLDTYKVNIDGSPVKELENLLNALVKQFTDLNIDYPNELLDSLKIYRKSFLNPSSHDDISSPLFRKEIEDAFKLVTKLQTLTKPIQKMKVAKGQIFKYHNPGMNYSMDIELCDSIFKTTFDGKLSISKHNFRICSWIWNGVPFADKYGNEYPKEQQVTICIKERELLEIFRGINKSTGIGIPDKPESQIIIGNGGSLEDLLKS